MTMTLEQVRDGLFACGKGHGFDNNQIDTLHGFARAINAHLTQPAQSVDVEMVREVIADLRGWGTAREQSVADKLTAALQENGNG